MKRFRLAALALQKQGQAKAIQVAGSLQELRQAAARADGGATGSSGKKGGAQLLSVFAQPTKPLDMSDAAVKNRARAAGTVVHQGGDVDIDDMLASLEAAAEGTGEGGGEEEEAAAGSGFSKI